MEMLFPVILKILLEWVEKTEFEISDGLLYASAMSLTVLARTFIGIHGDYILELNNAKIRNTIRVKNISRENLKFFFKIKFKI